MNLYLQNSMNHTFCGSVLGILFLFLLSDNIKIILFIFCLYLQGGLFTIYLKLWEEPFGILALLEHP